MATPENRRHFLTRRLLPVLGTVAFGTSVTAVVDGSVRATEIPQLNPWEIKFDIGSDHYWWAIDNAEFGINPPNDASRLTGLVKVAVNDIWYSSKYFQPLVNETLYPEIKGGPGVHVGIGGMAVDISLDRYYLGTSTSRNDIYYDPRFEIGTGIKTPESYTGRMVIRQGLPQGGIKGLMTSSRVFLGSDNIGNYTDYIFSDCINSSENGTYRIRRDNLGNLIGDTFVKISNSIVPGKPFQVFLPLDAKNY